MFKKIILLTFLVLGIIGTTCFAQMELSENKTLLSARIIQETQDDTIYKARIKTVYKQGNYDVLTYRIQKSTQRALVVQWDTYDKDGKFTFGHKENMEEYFSKETIQKIIDYAEDKEDN